MVTAFYNDVDGPVCAWLRELMAGGHISEGIVNDRSINELRGDDLAGYERVHLFAGIGGWDYALKLAGWPDGIPVWTGSCPCQPFSVAGRRRGTSDERHLWPEMRRLIEECMPPIVFGEQVASKDGREWLAGVRADLEALGYAVGAADLCAAGEGAPHIRQRLYWVAVAKGQRPVIATTPPRASRWRSTQPTIPSASGGLSDASIERRQQNARSTSCNETQNGREGRNRRESYIDHESTGNGPTRGVSESEHAERGPDIEGWRPEGGITTGRSGEGCARGLGNGDEPRLEGWVGCGERVRELSAWPSGAWSDYDIIPFRDGKARRVERQSKPLADGVSDRLASFGIDSRVVTETFPLVHGHKGRTQLLKGYGNSIVPQVAATFIETVMEWVGVTKEICW